MDNFTKHYLVTALWAENNGDEPLDARNSLEDIAEESKIKAQKDCDTFRQKAGSLLDDLEESKVAHDFWLTRNRHGAGFWDGDYEKNLGEKLTKISHEMGECHFYVGDDLKLYIE